MKKPTRRLVFIKVADAAGVEPATAWFVARYSIQLSYASLFKLVIYISSLRDNELNSKYLGRQPSKHSLRSHELFHHRCSYDANLKEWRRGRDSNPRTGINQLLP